MKSIVSDCVQISPQFYDLDPMNVVWHGNYARYYELARGCLFRKIGYGYDEMMASGYAWPVIDLHVRYYRPLTRGTTVDVTASITEWENRLRVDYLLRDARTKQRTTKGHTIQVAIEIASGKMLWETPPILRDKLSPYFD